AGRAGHLGHQAAVAPFALGHVGVPAQFRIDAAEHRLGGVQPGDHTFGLLLDARTSQGIGGHDGETGEVTLAEILAQRAVDQLLHAGETSASAAGVPTPPPGAGSSGSSCASLAASQELTIRTSSTSSTGTAPLPGWEPSSTDAVRASSSSIGGSGPQSRTRPATSQNASSRGLTGCRASTS